MSNRPALRFDAREIAVLFSLFIFVSLLMFTVGILVGKGLTQARYEGKLPSEITEPLVKSPQMNAGSSVSLGEKPQTTAPEIKTVVDETKESPGAPPKELASSPKEETAAPPAKVEPPPTAKGSTLKLIPLKPNHAKTTGVELTDPIQTETQDLLKNPKIISLLETEIPAAKEAAVAAPMAPKATAQTSSPKSASRAPASTATNGAWTVQVGSYPDETAAKERVDALKKLGFPQAYSSAKELGSTSGTWYRVWLGSYPDYDSAKKMGEQLRAQGEVDKYIVRKN